MKLSVIIPVYNIKKYLSGMIESMAKQAYQDMEILCVDDCSTDGCWEILQQWAKDDSRVHLMRHLKNMGLGAAHKSAVAQSIGEYILFLDGDDALKENACAELVETMERLQVDILHFGTEVVAQGNTKEEERARHQKVIEPYGDSLQREDLYNACFVEKLFGHTLWNKIYKGDIVRKAFELFTDERIYMAEDVLASFMIQFFSRTYASVDQVYYVYNFGDGITGGKKADLRLMEGIAQEGEVLRALDEFIAGQNAEERCKEARSAVRDTFVEAAMLNWGTAISPAHAARALDIVAPHFDREDLLHYCASHLEDGLLKTEELTRRLKGSQMFLRTKRQVRTIAAYYTRAYNGGAERVMCTLCDVWANAGYKVVLITDETENPFDYPYAKERIKRICLDPEKKMTTAERVVELYRTVEKNKVDAVVMHKWYSTSVLLDVMAIKMAGAAAIIHTHNCFSMMYRTPDLCYSLQGAQYGKICQLGDAVVTLSDVDTAWWQMWNLNVQKTSNPVTFSYEDRKNSTICSENHGDILWLGRLSPEKQVFDALRIIQRVREKVPYAHLHIVGKAEDEDYQKWVESKVEALGLEEAVTLHGFQTDVRSFYESASVFLCTSAYEGLPLTMVESKVVGVPCVSYNLLNVDMIREPRGMAVVAQGDVDEAAERIVELLTDSVLWEQMSSEAHASARDFCEYDQEKRWKEIIESVEAPAPETGSDALNATVLLLADDMTIGYNRIKESQGSYFENVERLEKELKWYADQKANLESDLRWLADQKTNLENDLKWCKDQLEEYQKRKTVPQRILGIVSGINSGSKGRMK